MFTSVNGKVRIEILTTNIFKLAIPTGKRANKKVKWIKNSENDFDSKVNVKFKSCKLIVRVVSRVNGEDPWEHNKIECGGIKNFAEGRTFYTPLGSA